MKIFMKAMALAAITVSFNAVMAQSGNEPEKPELSPEEKATKRTEQLKTELALSDAQTKQVYDINLAHILKMEEYRKEQQALREKIKAEKEATRTKIRSLLTTEQAVIFDQKAEEHKHKQEQRREKCQHEHHE